MTSTSDTEGLYQQRDGQNDLAKYGAYVSHYRSSIINVFF
jgi:hypothetical protein